LHEFPDKRVRIGKLPNHLGDGARFRLFCDLLFTRGAKRHGDGTETITIRQRILVNLATCRMGISQSLIEPKLDEG